MERIRYFIHGNGQDSSCAPNGFLADDMPGHGNEVRNPGLYSLSELAKFYTDKIPHGALVLGHSLGGHIALNVAMNRPDLDVYVCGMSPIQGLDEIGSVMTPVPEFSGFQNPERSEQDILAFIESVHENNEVICSKLLNTAKKQDPSFNMTLFTSGIATYDWNERTKAASLGSRFKIIISKNEKCYNADFMLETGLNIIENHYLSHTPWLFDSAWFDEIILASSVLLGNDSVSFEVQDQL